MTLHIVLLDLTPKSSILASKNAKDVAIEIFSLSKGYNMSGFRVGFAVGNKK